MRIGDYGAPASLLRGSCAHSVRRRRPCGFESLWCAEHPMGAGAQRKPVSQLGGRGEGPESYWALRGSLHPRWQAGFGGPRTERIKLGTGMGTLVPERNPLLLAKEISTLDLFSGGRFLFGIGTGWLREDNGDNGGRLRPSLDAGARFGGGDEEAVDSEGSVPPRDHYYNFPAVKSYPKPMQKPSSAGAAGGHGAQRTEADCAVGGRLDAQPDFAGIAAGEAGGTGPTGGGCGTGPGVADHFCARPTGRPRAGADVCGRWRTPGDNSHASRP